MTDHSWLLSGGQMCSTLALSVLHCLTLGWDSATLEWCHSWSVHYVVACFRTTDYHSTGGGAAPSDPALDFNASTSASLRLAGSGIWDKPSSPPRRRSASVFLFLFGNISASHSAAA